MPIPIWPMFDFDNVSLIQLQTQPRKGVATKPSFKFKGHNVNKQSCHLQVISKSNNASNESDDDTDNELYISTPIFDMLFHLHKVPETFSLRLYPF